MVSDLGPCTIDARKQNDKLLKFSITTATTKAGAQSRVPQLDVLLCKWPMIKRSDGVPISGPMLTGKGRPFPGVGKPGARRRGITKLDILYLAEK